jgi:FMN phosphatase YigB (HAD superfamily)
LTNASHRVVIPTVAAPATPPAHHDGNRLACARGRRRRRGLAGRFDAVLSVEEVGAFKPDRRVYQLAVDRLGISAAAIGAPGPMSGGSGEVGMQAVVTPTAPLSRERRPWAHQPRVASGLPSRREDHVRCPSRRNLAKRSARI